MRVERGGVKGVGEEGGGVGRTRRGRELRRVVVRCRGQGFEKAVKAARLRKACGSGGGVGLGPR